jgi:hypothetical protein
MHSALADTSLSSVHAALSCAEAEIWKIRIALVHPAAIKPLSDSILCIAHIHCIDA